MPKNVGSVSEINLQLCKQSHNKYYSPKVALNHFCLGHFDRLNVNSKSFGHHVNILNEFNGKNSFKCEIVIYAPTSDTYILYRERINL